MLDVTTKAVSLNLVHDGVYSIQHYVIKSASDLWQVGGFLRVLLVSSTNKADRHDITEILLKVALSTINHLSRKCWYDQPLFHQWAIDCSEQRDKLFSNTLELL